MKFLEQIWADLKNKPVAGTDAEKNAYRRKIMLLMVPAAVVCFMIHPFLAVIPLAVAARKWMIIQKSERQ
jgi:hypothetical protein